MWSASIGSFQWVLTPVGKSYCYTATRNISDFFAVSGLKQGQERLRPHDGHTLRTD